jgi:hypothetical protein
MSAFVPLHFRNFVGTPSLAPVITRDQQIGGNRYAIVLWLLGVPISLIVVAALFGAF